MTAHCNTHAGLFTVHRGSRSKTPSAETQCTIAHEVLHARQQTGGAVSMLPQEDLELEIDPDTALEREAGETAQRVMQGGELGIQRLADTDVHLQRIPVEKVPEALDMFKTENAGSGGSFKHEQNQDRIEFIEDELQWAIENVETNEDAMEYQEEMILDAKAAGDQERVESLQDGKESLADRIAELYDHLRDGAEQIALTAEQREKLYGENDFDGGEFMKDVGWTTTKALLSLVPGLSVIVASWEISESVVRQAWEQTDGSLGERLAQVKESIISDADTGETRFD